MSAGGREPDRFADRAGKKKRLVAGGLSRILSRSARAGLPPGLASDDHFSGPPVSRCLERPTRKSITGRADPYAVLRAGGVSAGCPVSRDPVLPCRIAPLFGLAPGGVCRARSVTRPAGELLPHRFTLTSNPSRIAAYSRRSILCCTVPIGAT